MRFAEPRLGVERAQHSYAWRSLLDAGATLAFGSDWPVETMSPLAGIHAAVTRQDAAGEPQAGWIPAQRITAEEALAAYTRGSAYAAHWESNIGTLEPGKFADITVLDRNILKCDANDILQTKVLTTIVSGHIVYEHP
jgi:predicted amidohydrolase YtcJ